MSNVYTKLSFSFDLGKDANDYLFKLANEIDSLVNNSDPDTGQRLQRKHVTSRMLTRLMI